MRNSNFHPTWKQKNNRKDKYAYSLKWFKTYKLKVQNVSLACLTDHIQHICFLASELSIEWAHSLYWQILFSRSWNGQILFCIKILWFYQKVLWNWYHQHARVVDWKYICYLCWTCFSTDIRHIYGYKICSSSCRRVPLFVWGRLHTGASQ